MPKLTGKPIKDELVGAHILVCGVRDLGKTFRGTMYATLGIQGFTLMLLLVCTVNSNETISFALGVSKLDEKCT